MKVEFFHIDKSGLVSDNFLDFNGVNYLITGEKSFNSFSSGFINEKKLILSKGIKETTYEKVISLFKNEDNTNVKEIISEIKNSDCSLLDLLIKRLLREVIFEDIRLNYFPLKPSRLKCVFLVDFLSNIEIWKTYLGINGRYVIYHFEKVDPNICTDDKSIVEKEHRTDAKLLEVDINDTVKVEENAHKYWDSRFTSNPLIEILFYGILKEKQSTTIL